MLRTILANGPVAVALAMEAVDIGLNCRTGGGTAFRIRSIRPRCSHGGSAVRGPRAFLENAGRRCLLVDKDGSNNRRQPGCARAEVRHRRCEIQ